MKASKFVLNLVIILEKNSIPADIKSFPFHCFIIAKHPNGIRTSLGAFSARLCQENAFS